MSDDSSAADHDSVASSDEASAFAAAALMVGPLAPSPDIETIAPLLDDVAFGVGLGSGALNAAVAEPSQSLKTFYIYAIGRPAVDALSSTTLPLLCERLSAQPPPPPPPPPGRQYVPTPAEGATAEALRDSNRTMTSPRNGTAYVKLRTARKYGRAPRDCARISVRIPRTICVRLTP